MAEAFAEMGHDVTFATVQGINWALVHRIFGKVPRVREIRLSPVASLLPYTYQIPSSILRFRKISREFDLTINTQGECVPAPADMLYIQGGFMFTISRHSDVYQAWHDSFPSWSYATHRAYFTPYAWFFDRTIDEAVQDSSVLLTNSSYSAKIVELETGITPEVLYPPVDIERFSCPTSAPKENLIITVGRFSPDKRYELIPRLARLCPEYDFAVVGTVTSRSTLDALKRQVSAIGASNVSLLVDLPVAELRRLYSRAKFYLHTKIGECFGITVVEAMSSSCVPIVPRSGGPWWDIVQRGKYGIGYSNEQEAAESIRKLDGVRYEDMKALAKQRSGSFSNSSFKKNLLEFADSSARN